MSKWKEAVAFFKDLFKPDPELVRKDINNINDIIKRKKEDLKNMQEERHDLILCLKLVGESRWRNSRLLFLQNEIELLEKIVEKFNY
jgi:hypothetical protein